MIVPKTLTLTRYGSINKARTIPKVFYKVIPADGVPRNGRSDFRYKYPVNGKPGAWMYVKDPKMCARGVHLVPAKYVNNWYHDEGYWHKSDRMFLAEARGTGQYAFQYGTRKVNKIVAQHVRLVRELTPKEIQRVLKGRAVR